MRLKAVLALAAVSLLGGVSAHAAAVVRVIVVETPDVAAYAKALDQGKTLMKSKGVPANLRILRARFAGDKAGSIVVTAEYASLEELAKADATMSSDAELRAWLQSLGKLRKIVSDSLYEDVVPKKLPTERRRRAPDDSLPLAAGAPSAPAALARESDSQPIEELQEEARRSPVIHVSQGV